MDVRRSAEKYHTACVACDKCKQMLVTIEQQATSNTDGDSVAVSVSAEKQDSLNKATDEVSALTMLYIATDHAVSENKYEVLHFLYKLIIT